MDSEKIEICTLIEHSLQYSNIPVSFGLQLIIFKTLIDQVTIKCNFQISLAVSRGLKLFIKLKVTATSYMGDDMMSHIH